jgi:hypothetical protein
MQNTIGKDSYPQAVGYNQLIAIPFDTVTLGASIAPSTVSARVPLGINVKIMSVSYVFSGTVAGSTAMNVSLGSASYETAGSAPFVTATFGGTWLVGDTYNLIVGGVSQQFLITSRTATATAYTANNNLVAADAAETINRLQPFGPGYYAYADKLILYIVAIAYNTAGNSVTFSRTLGSTSGTVTVSGGTFTGGTAGTLPTMPVLANSPLPIQGQHIPPLAAPGTALFPVDLPLNAIINQPGVLYPVNPIAQFDAIWPAGNELTLRLNTSSGATGNLKVILWAVPFDANPLSPQNKNTYFTPAYDIL